MASDREANTGCYISPFAFKKPQFFSILFRSFHKEDLNSAIYLWKFELLFLKFPLKSFTENYLTTIKGQLLFRYGNLL